MLRLCAGKWIFRVLKKGDSRSLRQYYVLPLLYIENSRYNIPGKGFVLKIAMILRLYELNYEINNCGKFYCKDIQGIFRDVMKPQYRNMPLMENIKVPISRYCSFIERRS
jgi:hypothetical protein